MLAMFEPLLVLGIVSVYGLRGAGETQRPMWVTLISTFAIRLPVAWFAVQAGWGLKGAWLGMCADITVRGIANAAMFYRGGWARLRI
jgi:Na+-driven multidrug efflux pump